MVQEYQARKERRKIFNLLNLIVTKEIKFLKRHAFLGLYLLVFSPAFFENYAWSDDFSALAYPNAVGEHALLDARPIYGLAIGEIFQLVETLENLRWVRLLTVIGIYLLANWVHRFLSERTELKHLKLAIFAGFCCSAWANVAFWAIAFIVPWAAFFACQGIVYSNNRKNKIKLFGIALLVVAWLCYPPAVFFSLAVMYLKSLVDNESPSKTLMSQLKQIPYLGISAILAFIVAKLSVQFWTASNFNDRISIPSFNEIPSKVYFFLTRQIVQSFRPLSLDTSSNINIAFEAMLVILLLSYLFYLNSRTILISAMQSVIFVLVIVEVQILHLVTAENQIEIRHFIVSNWLVVVTFFVQINRTVFRGFKDALQGLKVTSLGLSLILGFAPLGFFYSVVFPIVNETRTFLLKTIDSCTNSELVNSVILERVSIWPSNPNLGMASQVTDLASPWVPHSAINILTMNLRQIDIKPIYIERGGDIISEGVCLFDLEKFEINKGEKD